MSETSKKILEILNIKDVYDFHEINSVSLSGIKLNDISPLFPRID